MSYGQPFWRIAQPQFSSQSAKKDLAQFLDTIVLIFNICVDRNVQLQLEEGKEKTKEQVSCDLKEFCMAGIFNISRVYKYNLSRQIERLDFNNGVTQWGYMYVNMCRHIHLVYHVMSTALRQNRITVHSKMQTSICAIGAGPGSDVLGLLMFFREAGIHFPFSEINLLDRCVAWNDSWRSLIEKLPKDMSGALGECNYHHFDFFNDELTDKLRRVINKATFVTFVKSVSPVSAWLRGKQFHYRKFHHAMIVEVNCL
ncbi:hypothetical protein BSL78_10889 [Apostichopus japonicus]|uniref:Uncharacterized protein n=1 Tax=Stichopus japonicus TaxID=307972 RepID=A0A2G8KW41_STIJA|nr:hypothetical protein BSL78_10889 [Apostichopus japonicus]